MGKLVRWSSVGWLAKSEPRLHAQISISLDRALLNICIRRSTPVLGFSRFETGRTNCACHPECNNHWGISSSVLTRILALQYTRGGRFCIASLMTPRHEFHFHIIARHPNSHSRPRTHHLEHLRTHAKTHLAIPTHSAERTANKSRGELLNFGGKGFWFWRFIVLARNKRIRRRNSEHGCPACKFCWSEANVKQG